MPDSGSANLRLSGDDVRDWRRNGVDRKMQDEGVVALSGTCPEWLALTRSLEDPGTTWSMSPGGADGPSVTTVRAEAFPGKDAAHLGDVVPPPAGSATGSFAGSEPGRGRGGQSGHGLTAVGLRAMCSAAPWLRGAAARRRALARIPPWAGWKSPDV